MPSRRHRPKEIPHVEVQLDYRVNNGQPGNDKVCVSRDDGRPLTPGEMRKVAEVYGKLVREDVAEILAPYRRRGRRVGVPRDRDEFLQLVAAIYTEAVRAGSVKPVVDTARKLTELKALGDRPVPVKTASAWVARARAAEHLPPTQHGAAHA